MNRTNRQGKYQDDGSGGYMVDDLPDEQFKLHYYVQNIDAGDEHRNVQSDVEDTGNYSLFSEIRLDPEWSFSIEEFINIEGFITPTPAT